AVLFCSSRSLFFFQAEDGIRDFHVTGVQTCALPISPACYSHGSSPGLRRWGYPSPEGEGGFGRQNGRLNLEPCAWLPAAMYQFRSEERRVGKGGRSRWRGPCGQI